MNPAVLRGLLSFLFPGGLIVLAVAVVARTPATAPWLEQLTGLFPLAVCATALILGWRFDRSRLLFATVMITLGAVLLASLEPSNGSQQHPLFDAIATLLPLNIALIALIKERGIFTLHGLLRWGVIAGQPVAAWLALRAGQYDWLLVFQTPLISSAALDRLALAQPALLAFALAMLVTLAQGLRQRSAMEFGLFWALALMLFTLLFGYTEQMVGVFFAFAILILIVAMLEVSHFMAYRDELTGLPGRRALNEALLKLGSRYTIAMLDVDHFKKFNDSYGHDVGDEVLKMVAAKMGGVKGGGKVFRYGGEEFTVLFPGKRVDDALPHLERLRASIADSPFTVRGKNRPRKKGEKPIQGSDKQVQITISIGAAEPDDEAREPQAVIKAADKALYKAKKAGRNRVAA